jgi:hypothetical protein
MVVSSGLTVLSLIIKIGDASLKGGYKINKFGDE